MRQWIPVAKLVLYWGQRGLDAIENFERCDRSGNIKLHTFSKLAQVQDPAYLEDVLVAMKSKKPNVGQFNQAVVRCAKRQWYTWTVMHPGLPVHEERSMQCSLYVMCRAA